MNKDEGQYNQTEIVSDNMPHCEEDNINGEKDAYHDVYLPWLYLL